MSSSARDVHRPAVDQAIVIMGEISNGALDLRPERFGATVAELLYGVLYNYNHGIYYSVMGLLPEAPATPIKILLRSMIETTIHLNYLASQPDGGQRAALRFWNEEYTRAKNHFLASSAPDKTVTARFDARLDELAEIAKSLGLSKIKGKVSIKDMARDAAGDARFGKAVAWLHDDLSHDVHPGVSVLMQQLSLPDAIEEPGNLGTLRQPRPTTGEILDLGYIATDAMTSGMLAVARGQKWPRLAEVERLRVDQLGRLEGLHLQ